MSKMIQIRNVPDDVHLMLKIRAAEAGMTLSDYLLREVRTVADRPTLEEMSERLRGHRPSSIELQPGEAARIIREQRGPLGRT